MKSALFLTARTRFHWSLTRPIYAFSADRPLRPLKLRQHFEQSVADAAAFSRYFFTTLPLLYNYQLSIASTTISLSGNALWLLLDGAHQKGLSAAPLRGQREAGMRKNCISKPSGGAPLLCILSQLSDLLTEVRLEFSTGEAD